MLKSILTDQKYRSCIELWSIVFDTRGTLRNKEFSVFKKLKQKQKSLKALGRIRHRIGKEGGSEAI